MPENFMITLPSGAAKMRLSCFSAVTPAIGWNSCLLCGKRDEQRIKYRADDFYEKHRANVLLGREATSISPKARTVQTAGGAVSYDRLLVATGNRPFVPPAEGMELIERKFTFLPLDDAHTLEAALFPGAKMLIVGAGLIRLKCAEGIAGKYASITVVYLADRILPPILDEKGSAIMQKHIEAHGVTSLLGDSGERFTAGGGMSQEREDDPLRVVFAVGVHPNTEIVKEAGGSNVIGLSYEFIGDPLVRLIGCAAGRGCGGAADHRHPRSARAVERHRNSGRPRGLSRRPGGLRGAGRAGRRANAREIAGRARGGKTRRGRRADRGEGAPGSQGFGQTKKIYAGGVPFGRSGWFII